MSQHQTHDAYIRYRTGLTISLAVVLIQMIVLFFMGRGAESDWSIGLFEDAMHGIADNLILIGTTIVLYFEAHGASPNKGRKRILALIGGVLLVLAGFGGGYIAYERIIGAQMHISGWVLASTSLIAVIGGGSAFWIIHGIDKSMHDHLHTSAVGHLVGDLAISAAVFLSALGIIFFRLPAIDSWAALCLIAPWMIFRGIQILKYKDPPECGHGDMCAHPHDYDDHRDHHH